MYDNTATAHWRSAACLCSDPPHSLCLKPITLLFELKARKKKACPHNISVSPPREKCFSYNPSSLFSFTACTCPIIQTILQNTERSICVFVGSLYLLDSVKQNFWNPFTIIRAFMKIVSHFSPFFDTSFSRNEPKSMMN